MWFLCLIHTSSALAVYTMVIGTMDASEPNQR